jgi:hypothetical protein
MFLDNRKDNSVHTYCSALSRYLEPSNIVYIRLMSSGFPDVDYHGNTLWHDIQVLYFSCSCRGDLGHYLLC